MFRVATTFWKQNSKSFPGFSANSSYFSRFIFFQVLLAANSTTKNDGWPWFYSVRAKHYQATWITNCCCYFLLYTNMKNKRKNIFEKTYHQCKIVIQYAQEIWMLLIYREQCKIKNIRYVEINRTGLVMSCQSVLNIELSLLLSTTKKYIPRLLITS